MRARVAVVSGAQTNIMINTHAVSGAGAAYAARAADALGLLPQQDVLHHFGIRLAVSAAAPVAGLGVVIVQVQIEAAGARALHAALAVVIMVVRARFPPSARPVAALQPMSMSTMSMSVMSVSMCRRAT